MGYLKFSMIFIDKTENYHEILIAKIKKWSFHNYSNWYMVIQKISEKYKIQK